MTSGALQRRRILVPESRELDLFAAMLERHGAEVLRCPLVRIIDLVDPAPLDAWLHRLCAGEHEVVAFYTGEGVSRSLERAAELGLQDAAVEALRAATTLARGPKPIAALRRAGLAADHVAAQPTTAGLLATLSSLPLSGRSVGVQLYPDGPAAALQQCIESRGGRMDAVTPYQYATDEQDSAVAAAIREILDGRVDLVAFTSSPQVRRLAEVVARLDLAPDLEAVLARTKVAAIGPSTAETVRQAGGLVAVQPAASFHLKPLTADIIREIGEA